jgi:pyruvate formate lyase activating enzyme
VWPRFAAELLRRLKAEGINTAIETCGQAQYRDIELLLPNLDLIYYDVKLMDPAKHRQLTGADNRLVLANLLRLARSGVPIIVRIPVIPGVNDDEENISATAAFVSEHELARKVELLPYHRLAQDKYARLGRAYAFSGMEPPESLHLEQLAELVRHRGLECQIGG